MTRKILVAYDSSELSKKAIQEAKREVSNIPGTEVHVVSVAETTGPPTDGMITDNITNEIAENAHKQLRELQENFEKEKIDIVTKVVVAKRNESPGKSICEYAQMNEIDMIIVGSRGLGNVKGMFLGSVSKNIVENANVPILIVK